MTFDVSVAQFFSDLYGQVLTNIKFEVFGQQFFHQVIGDVFWVLGLIVGMTLQNLKQLRVPNCLFGHEISRLHFLERRMFEAAIFALQHSCLLLLNLATQLFLHVIGVILFDLFVHR